MDKLKPIIDQKFWIFLGLALIIPFVGWYLASSSYATGVEDRENEINSSFSSVNLSGDVVNQDWVDGAQEIVKEQQGLLQKSQQQLWLTQSENMDWPPNVTPFMKDVPYESEAIPVRALEFYSKGYHPQLAEMERRLQPFNYLTGEGVLLFDGYQTGGAYPYVPESQWINQPPTPKEMWNAQIDFWLVRAVFDSIISMNQGSKKITEAPIRQLLELKLRGGTRDYTAGSTSSESGGSTETGDFSGMEMYGPEGGGGGSSSVDSIKTTVQFDLSEELGPDGSGSGSIGGGGGIEDMFESSSTGESTSEATAQGPTRYVDDDENSPFRTRAFILGVVMDQKVLPEFLAELSRSDWPIQIIRVQTATVNPEELRLANTRLTRPGTGMRPGGSRFGGSSSFDSGEDSGSIYGMPCGGESPFSSAGGSMGRGPRTSIPGAGAGQGAGLVQQAMSDPYLAEVWIGGLITLFRPVEETDSATAENGSPQEGTTESQLNESTGSESTETQPEAPAGQDSTTTPPGESPSEPGTESSSGTDETGPSETGTDDTQPTETPPDSTGPST